MPGKKTIVSHRGLSGDEPENTLEAIAASVARGVEAIEVDIRLTADGVPILFHDPSVGGAVVARSTHAELASHVPDLPSWPPPVISTVIIPIVSERQDCPAPAPCAAVTDPNSANARERQRDKTRTNGTDLPRRALISPFHGVIQNMISSLRSSPAIT